MRILHVIRCLDLRSGGPAAAIRGFVSAQIARGHEIAVLATAVQSGEPWRRDTDFRTSVCGEPAFAGAEIHMVRALGRRRPWTTYAYSPETCAWISRRLHHAQHPPDVVHIHGVFSHLTSAAARQCRRAGIPYVIRPAGTLNPKCFCQGRHRVKQLVASFQLRGDLEAAACLHATSPDEASHLASWVAREKIDVVPLGVNVPNFDRDEAAELLWHRFPQLRGRRVILYMSRITVKKRPEWLPEVLARLPADCQDVTVLFAGASDEHLPVVRAAVQRFKVEDRVVFAGYLEGEWKQAAFAAASVFALPSIDENFGVATVEALAHGVPAVVTRGVASHRYVDESRCGMVADDSPAGLARALSLVLRSNREETGQRGRTYVLENLSWAQTVAMLDAMYVGCTRDEVGVEAGASTR